MGCFAGYRWKVIFMAFFPGAIWKRTCYKRYGVVAFTIGFEAVILQYWCVSAADDWPPTNGYYFGRWLEKI
jgi:hypothetical protein